MSSVLSNCNHPSKKKPTLLNTPSVKHDLLLHRTVSQIWHILLCFHFLPSAGWGSESHGRCLLPPPACSLCLSPCLPLSTSWVSRATSTGCSDSSPRWCLLASSSPYLVLAATQQPWHPTGCFISFSCNSSSVLAPGITTPQGTTSCCTPLKPSGNTYFTKKT